MDATNPIQEGYSFTVFECRKTHGGISHWDFAYVSRRRISTWPEVQSRLREKGEGKGDQNFTLAHHRCHQWSCRAIEHGIASGSGSPSRQCTCALQSDSSDETKRAPPIVRSESARLEPLGQVVITYQFIKIAVCLLETRRSISLVIILSYLQDHLQLSSSMWSPFMPC